MASGETRRATVYIDSELHRAVRLRAAETEVTISDIVNTALRQLLAEDAEDFEAFERRRDEEDLDFEAVVRGLRDRGAL
ncbi:MAG TPA: CopG family transcriptional regulator [Candidatus Binatia bacterium]|nr:CopG family transcriptional regulator [Candidatus Binatia bacterium]